jgi:hypothetical protein
MICVNYEECEAADLDPAEVDRIAKRINRAAADARKLGLEVFGGSSSGSLRVFSDGNRGVGQLVVAEMTNGSWNGGDGATDRNHDGLMRGEC